MSARGRMSPCGDHQRTGSCGVALLRRGLACRCPCQWAPAVQQTAEILTTRPHSRSTQNISRSSERVGHSSRPHERAQGAQHQGRQVLAAARASGRERAGSDRHRYGSHPPRRRSTDLRRLIFAFWRCTSRRGEISRSASRHKTRDHASTESETGPTGRTPATMRVIVRHHAQNF